MPLRAISGYHGSFGLNRRRAPPDAIADEASVLAGTGLPASWFNDQQAQIAAVSADQASAAFSAAVRPERLSVVLCGDADQLLTGLEAQGLAAEVVTIDG